MIVVATALLAAQEPRPVTPGLGAAPPSDAIVLFDGASVAEWQHPDGRPPGWTVVNGELVLRTGTGDLVTRRKFGGMHLHIEFALPMMPSESGQARGNSGIYVQGRYEIQILDSYANPTYPDGQAAAVYGQHIPLVNASRPPEQWQSYDLFFRAPVCTDSPRPQRPAMLTMLHNGLLVHHAVPLRQPTAGGDETPVCEPGPIRIQDHAYPGGPVTPIRFRNIWARETE